MLEEDFKCLRLELQNTTQQALLRVEALESQLKDREGGRIPDFPLNTFLLDHNCVFTLVLHKSVVLGCSTFEGKVFSRASALCRGWLPSSVADSGI